MMACSVLVILYIINIMIYCTGPKYQGYHQGCLIVILLADDINLFMSNDTWSLD
jgi:hypothetical protein